jgi:hypothetical protein
MANDKLDTQSDGQPQKYTFEDIIEMDETYVGGKPRRYAKKYWDADEDLAPVIKRGRGTTKTLVVGIKERNRGKVYARVVQPDAQGRKLTGKQLYKIARNVLGEDNIIMTDDFRAYNIFDRKGCEHGVVKHAEGEYSAGGGIHTNGIEGF